MAAKPATPSSASADPIPGYAPGTVTLGDLVDVSAVPRVLRRILALSLVHRGRLAMAIGAAIAANAAAIVLPRLLGHAVDQAHAELAGGAAASLQPLFVLAALLLAVGSLRGLLTMVSGYQFEHVGQRVAYALRLSYFDKLQQLDFAFHDRIHSGDLITRGMLDLEGVRMFVENGVQRVVSLVLLLGIGAAAMIATDPTMGLLALSFVPFVLWQAVRTGLVLRLNWTLLQQKMSDLTRTIEENLQGARVVRAFAAWVFETTRFDTAARAALAMANRRISIRSRSVASMTFAFYLSMALVLWLGGQRIAAGTMSVGDLTAFLAFMLLLQAPVRQVMMVVNTFARAMSSGARVFEILDREPDLRDGPLAAAVPAGALTFSDVGFRHASAPDAPWILRGIDLRVRPGETLGIIGPPGAGKSTLVHLIPRFYDVSEGRIALGGVDLRDLSLDRLRAAVTIVQQDTFLFDASFSENIAYAFPETEEPAIEAASRRAQLHAHVAALPDGYATHTGERGVALSGGQRQRLSIARGIVGDPHVLILDDSTSALDAATEQTLRRDLRAYARDKVTIIVSHRIASLRHADQIVVIDQGRIVERGTHRELERAGGAYARLCIMQQSTSVEPAQPAQLAS